MGSITYRVTLDPGRAVASSIALTHPGGLVEHLTPDEAKARGIIATVPPRHEGNRLARRTQAARDRRRT